MDTVWKAAAGLTAAIALVTAGVAYGGSNAPTEDDVKQIVATQSPYARDKGALLTKLDGLSTSLADVDAGVDLQREEIAQLRADVARLEERIAALAAAGQSP